MVKSDYSIKRGQTEISFPSSAGGITTVVHPFFGPADYKTLFSQIKAQEGLRLPTGQDYADFLHAVYVGDSSTESREFRESPEATEARNKMKSLLYVPNVNIWTPESFNERYGVYVVFDKQGVGIDFEFDQNALERKLSKGKEIKKGVILSDGVGFAHRETYSGGEHTPEELAQSGFMIASSTLSGAKKLAEVSKQFKNNPHVWIVDNPTEPVKRVSAFYDNYSGLIANGDYDGDYYGAFSVGVKS